MDTKALRQKVLDLAIRGKLVPQDPNDEPASVLLERIRAEKAQMVKEGKLKPKDIKNDTVIYVGDDNLHYEKFQDGTVKCIEDEIPFDVPDGWEWSRLGTISAVVSDGDHQPPPQTSSGIPFLVISNVSDGTLCFANTRFVSKEYYDVLPESRKPHKGDLLFTVTGSYGIPVIVDCNKEFCFQRHIAIIRPCIITNKYLSILLESKYIKAICDDKATGTAQKTIGLGTLRELLIPIAPFNEQQRIFEQAEKALCLIANIASNNDELKNAIEKTKSKILSLAISGKLVFQASADEPASILLGRIQAEKESLIKEGKLKKDKKESVIFRGDDNSYYVNINGEVTDITDELPFEIPDSWAWGKLQDIFIINPKNQLEDDLDVSFIPMPRINDGFTGAHTSEPRKWKEIKKGFTHFREGDVVVAKITPCFENRKSAILSGLINGYGAGTTELHVIRPYENTILPEYILAVMKSNYFIDLGKQTFSGAVGQQRFSKEFFMGLYFPIPPFEEQKRIISQIRCLFSKLDMIEKALS